MGDSFSYQVSHKEKRDSSTPTPHPSQPFDLPKLLSFNWTGLKCYFCK